MAPTADFLPARVVEPPNLVNEKTPVLVEVSPAPKENIPSEPSTSTNPLQPRTVPNFELEDHPIDVIRKLRVSILSTRNLQNRF